MSVPVEMGSEEAVLTEGDLRPVWEHGTARLTRFDPVAGFVPPHTGSTP